MRSIARAAHPAAVIALLGLLGSVPPAEGQEAPPEQPAARSTGLPPQIEWTFDFDAGFGAFGFLNSLYTNPRDEPSGDLSDNWFEGFIKPALSGQRRVGAGSLYGKLSAVGERTYGAAPSLVGDDFSSFGVDDLHIGWRSGATFGALGDDALDVRVGRSEYTLGHGFLLWDGAAEGGSRGGYWSNARKAFEFAAIGRLKTSIHAADVFYLDRDELPELDDGNRLWGVNYEITPLEDSTIGVTYLRLSADRRPSRDGLNVFNARAFVKPIPPLSGLSLEAEVATQSNGALRHSQAWTLGGAYELSGIAWTPEVSYRYARFAGNKPGTLRNEAFDPLFPGFVDWGTWWQGEIAGEYFLSNSNLISHQIRVHTTPGDRVETGVLMYGFTLDEKGSYGPGVTSSSLGFELDWYLDWTITRTLSASIVGAFANPGDAVQQALDRTKNLSYAMAYLTYSY